VSLGVMVLMNLVEWFVFIALLSLPAAIKVIRLVSSSAGKPSSHLAFADVLTAQLHMKFGLLFTAGIVIGRWL
jgi:1,4-dihydroxy-2-naphthoate octaprenyltransferase